MDNQLKKILLIDVDDSRRASRVLLLEQAGYEVFLRGDWTAAELSKHESACDLVLIALHDDPKLALAYAERLAKHSPELPVLLLSDTDVFVPLETLSPNIAAGNPRMLMEKIATMLAVSNHVRMLSTPPQG
jgi:hypothetical protein